jgi:predicted nucleic-acid-binding protein
VKLIADTNLLVRAAVQDDLAQARLAMKALEAAELIVVPVPCFCEFAWVLLRAYKFTEADTAQAIQALLDIEKMVTNRPAVEAGLAVLNAGGDFADGVIAFEGRTMGGEVFVSLDAKAVKLLSKNKIPAQAPK